MNIFKSIAPKHLLSLIFGIFWVFTSVGAETQTNLLTNQGPVVYAYWAGWTNAPIPSLAFNGLMLSFAEMKKDNQGNFYSDYSASGNFQLPNNTGPYVTWNTWARTYFSTGARAYVSYGGGTDTNTRGYIIYGTPTDLSNMAGEIKANVKKYYFGGVDLDIENWWSYNQSQNLQFATNLDTLVKLLRASLDQDPATQGTPITISVGWNSAGAVQGISDGGSAYTGTMLPFFNDSAAMNAISSINIMSYDININNFYSQLNLVGNILKTFASANIPTQKLVFGIQPLEYPGFLPTQLTAVQAVAQFVKQNNYGGVFLWGIGTTGLGNLSAYDYINAMQAGLS